MPSNSSPSPSSKPALDDRLIFGSTGDEDDASRDGRRSADGGDRQAGQASDNSYLQSAHQGGSHIENEDVPHEAGASANEDGAVYLGDDQEIFSPGAMSGEFMYDAGALFPDLDMSGTASFSVEGPDWLVVDPATGLLTGAPGAQDVGVQAFTVTATDAGGARFAQTLQFTVESQDGAPVVTDVLVAPSPNEAPADAPDAEAPAQDVAPDAPSEEDSAAPAEELAQDAAPSAPEAPAAEQPPVAEEPSTPPSAPEPPVQDAAPPAPEAPPAPQPPVAEEPSAPPAAPEPPVQETAPPAPEVPPAPQPPVAEEPSAPPAAPEPPVQETAPPAPETPPAPEPPAAEEPVSPPPAPEPPVQVAPPVAPPAPPVAPPAAPPAPPKSYNVITGTKNADHLVGTKGDDQITGGAGNDKMQGGKGDDEYVFKAGNNGVDVFDDGKSGDGYDVVVATDSNVVIGVDGYNDGRSFTSKGVTVTSTGVDEFKGAGDTIVRDNGSAHTLNFSHTKLDGILEVDAAGGNDKVIASDLSDASYRGGAGNDTLTAGDAKATWLYSGASNGSDTFVNGDGQSVALAQGKGVVIGVNGYANGVDAFEGQGDTVVRDTGSAHTLNFSQTELSGVLEVDAAGGNDKVIASDLSDASYRGGAGNDTLTAGKADATWLYKGSSNGSDSFVNSEGHSVAQAEGKGVVIGVNGYANGVDAFEGNGDTIVRDSGSSHTLDFSNTELTGIQEVDAGGGNDKVVASDLSDASYRGGAGDDTLTAGKADATWLYKGASNGSDTFVNGEGHSVAVAQGKGVVIGVNGYANGVDAFEGKGDTIVRDGGSSRTLDFSSTEMKGVLEVDAGAGNDTVLASNLSDGAYRGGAGDDALTAGSKATTWLYGAGDNGFDSFTNGSGVTLAKADAANVVIGVNGYANGVDAFEGKGDTKIQDSNSSRTLDFSNTELNGVLEVDARGGNDTLLASNLSDGAYRGGTGDDALTAGSKATTWLYGAGDNGFDSFTNGSGVTVAKAEGAGVTIGVNGFANGVDAFDGAGDTKIQDSNSSRTLDFSNTELNGVLEVDARGGNDAVLASNLSDASYRGGTGDDALTAGSARATWLYGSGDNGFDAFTNGAGVSVAEAQGANVVIGLNGYANGVDGFHGAGDTVLRDSGSSHTLNFGNTAFKDVAEVDAGAGNDTVTASNHSEMAYRGGAGDDKLIAGEQRTVFVYGAGNNGYDTLTNGSDDSLAQAEDKGVVIGVNGYANGVDGFLGVGDTVVRDSNSGHALDFSNTALKGVAEVDGAGGNDTITVSNLSEGHYRGGAGDDVLVVQKGAASAVIADFDDAGNDRIDLSAFGSNRGALEKATSLVDSDGDGQADDVQIDLGALGGEKGATLTLLDTDLAKLNFAAKGDFTVAGDSGAKFAKGQELMAAEGDVDQLFAFDMDTLDASSGWTAALDAPTLEADAFADAGGDPSSLIVFEDGSDNIQASINDSQWG